MNIIVCLKQIMDPEIPVFDFPSVDQKGEAVGGNVNLVTNILCENALETALQLREKSGGKITVLTFGRESAEDTLRKALAVKADEAVLVINDGHPHPDSLAVAQVLSGAIRKIGTFDLILLGRQSVDWGCGLTGGLLAEELGVPCITLADQIEIAEDRLFVERKTDRGSEMLSAKPPLVMTIANNEFNVPRIPEAHDIATSALQPIERWRLEDLGVNAAEIRAGGSSCKVVDLSLGFKYVDCEFVPGDSLEDKVDGFARRIVEVIRGS